MDNKAYIIERKDSEKKVVMHFDGFLDAAAVKNFAVDYDKLTKEVNTAETTLVLDGKKLKAFPPEAENDLMNLYKSYTIFKKIYILNPDILITKMQVKRVLKNAGIAEKFEFIDNVSDAR